MSFEEQIAQLSDLSKPLSHNELRILANLGPESLKIFWQAWRQFPGERRITIIHDINALAEDNVDLDFRPVFRACLGDSDPEVRASAVAGLWEDASEGTMDRLIRLIDDDSGAVREAAVVALAAFAYRGEVGEMSSAATQRVYGALLRTATDPEQPIDVRRRAVEGLGYFAGSKDAQAEIGRAYAHPELTVRESAVLAMGRSMRPTWFPYIERELKSPSPAMRYEAARAVGELGEDGQPMLPSLLPLVDDDDGEISTAAIWSLGQVGGPSAKRVLQRLAKSKDEARRTAATEALEELSLGEL
ncbi:HEAT repeat domain-containing protein [Oscillochloris sp. ZM17-4]|uniref:HEAT repeat domain-containing protein n=1 Tax=Oscillochloris sp. ZM17-4 TaxID=2866714 RepID=UPI001C73865D|nr:HEAT repeat domain-containing protein [Oscillochloris sp. ZM17-4]MBX0327251.1 HEAT repeat domain-containing protein [Oscillochloris sp. ZM17-4]